MNDSMEPSTEHLKSDNESIIDNFAKNLVNVTWGTDQDCERWPSVGILSLGDGVGLIR